jgi:hypothetical protein
VLSDARVLTAYLIFFGSYLVERAAAEGVHLGFREYFRAGLPVTVAMLAVGSIWSWLTQ